MRMMRMVRMESVVGSAKGMTGSKMGSPRPRTPRIPDEPQPSPRSLKVQRRIFPFRISLYVGAIVCSSLESQPSIWSTIPAGPRHFSGCLAENLFCKETVTFYHGVWLNPVTASPPIFLHVQAYGGQHQDSVSGAVMPMLSWTDYHLS